MDTQDLTKEEKVRSQLEMESLINRYIADIETLRGKIKEQNNMFKDTFENDKEYSEHSVKVKDATKARNGVKQKLMKQPGAVDTSEKLKDLKGELKEAQEALSDYVREYQRFSNMNQITLPNGDIMQIVQITKLRKVRKDQ